jgi:hypothetical protein
LIRTETISGRAAKHLYELAHRDTPR